MLLAPNVAAAQEAVLAGVINGTNVLAVQGTNPGQLPIRPYTGPRHTAHPTLK